MEDKFTENQLRLFENTRINLLVDHDRNRDILRQYLETRYQVITRTEKSRSRGSPDLIIMDEQGLNDYKQELIENKRSTISLFLPVILITRNPLKEIDEECQQLVDEIVRTPIQREVLLHRIQNLLNIRKLFLSTQIYQKLTENNPAGICILQGGEYIKYVNRAFLQIVEEEKEEILDSSIFEYFTTDEFKAQLNRNPEAKTPEVTVRLEGVEPNKWINIRFSQMEYEHINLRLLIMLDVTEQKQAREQIKYLSFHDQLTGLYNRNYFMEELKRLDSPRQLPLTLIMGDVNSLKLVNDAFGHEQGDRLLKEIGDILQQNLRQEDILARIGGDEFGVLLPQTGQKTGQEIATRIKQTCRQTSLAPLTPSIALGVATKDKAERDVEEIMKLADEFMYREKMSERDQVKNKIMSRLENTLQEKTYETSEHIQRIEELALKLADKLELDHNQCEKLKLLARAHDMGKISLSEKILKKPGRLSREEFEKVKTHAESGYRIAQSISDLSLVAEEILSHHERWDGKGYPRGLKEEEIPLVSRIIAIIDAFVVMTHDRPYRQAIKPEQALREIEEYAGTQFDPQLARKFVEMQSGK